MPHISQIQDMVNLNGKCSKAWLHEMVLRLGPSAVMYANHFPNADANLIRAFQEFGTDLILGFKNDDG